MRRQKSGMFRLRQHYGYWTMTAPQRPRRSDKVPRFGGLRYDEISQHVPLDSCAQRSCRIAGTQIRKNVHEVYEIRGIEKAWSKETAPEAVVITGLQPIPDAITIVVTGLS